MYLVIDRCTRSTRCTLVKLVPLHSGVQYSGIGRAKAQYNIDFVCWGACHWLTLYPLNDKLSHLKLHPLEAVSL